MKLDLEDDQVELVINALRYIAQNEAGQTQAPDLCKPEDYIEYDLAADIERRYDRSRVLRSLWRLNEQTGEKTMR